MPSNHNEFLRLGVTHPQVIRGYFFLYIIGTVIAQIFVRDLISYISYFWRKVRNLVAYENHTRMHVYLTPPSLYENF